MVRFAHEGLELWYGTPDAPAPDGTNEARAGVSVTVGVRPAMPGNAVRVRYRVDGRDERTVSAPLVANDYERRIQYFRASFPTLWRGDTVEYLPILSSAGRRVPDPATASTFPSSFRLDQPVEREAKRSLPAEPRGLFPFRLEYLVTKRVTLAAQPELVGQTPAGYVVYWPPTGGTVDGPAFRATVRPDGEHELIVRPDGVGILSVRVTLETDDHALISVRYSGTLDLGPDGAERARTQQWPIATPVHSAPRLLTAHPKYLWLNRLECLGIGEIRVADLAYTYDLYGMYGPSMTRS